MDFQAKLKALQQRVDNNNSQKTEFQMTKEEREKIKKINKEKSIARDEILRKRSYTERKKAEEQKEMRKKEEEENKLKRQKTFEEKRQLEEEEKERERLLNEEGKIHFRELRNTINALEAKRLLKEEEEKKRKEERINLLEKKLREKEEKKKKNKQQILKEIYERNVDNIKEGKNDNNININSNNSQDSTPVIDEISRKLIEDMVIFSQIVKEEIESKTEEEKKESYIPIEEALEVKDKNDPAFILGVLAKALEDNGAEVVIEKTQNGLSDEENQIFANNTIQFLSSGLSERKKFLLHFDFGEEKNLELLTDKDEQKKFNDNLRKKLGEEYNINEESIIITNSQRGSYAVNVIFMD